MHWFGRARLLILTLICLFWTGLIFLGYFFPAAPFLSTPWRGEQSFEDLLRREGRKTTAPPDFVFLGIDQARGGRSRAVVISRTGRLRPAFATASSGVISVVRQTTTGARTPEHNGQVSAPGVATSCASHCDRSASTSSTQLPKRQSKKSPLRSDRQFQSGRPMSRAR